MPPFILELAFFGGRDNFKRLPAKKKTISIRLNWIDANKCKSSRRRQSVLVTWRPKHSLQNLANRREKNFFLILIASFICFRIRASQLENVTFIVAPSVLSNVQDLSQVLLRSLTGFVHCNGFTKSKTNSPSMVLGTCREFSLLIHGYLYVFFIEMGDHFGLI